MPDDKDDAKPEAKAESPSDLKPQIAKRELMNSTRREVVRVVQRLRTGRKRIRRFGKVKEFYFDDQHWTIRFLVAETGNWLTDRQVLISPYALVEVNKEKELIAIN